MELIGTGNFMRSAEMEYFSLIMQEHVAHDVVERIGELGCVQFTDLNGDLTAFKRHYTPLVRRCDDMEKKIKFFTQEMAEYGISPERYTSAELKTWTDNQRESLAREHVGTSLLDYWETIIGERHRDYQAIKSERERTAALLYQAVQRRHVIEKAADFFLFESRNNAAWTEAAAPTSASGAAARDLEASTAAAGRRAGEEDDMSFRHIAGIISTDDKVRFSRIIFRASSGHAVVRFADIWGELIDEQGRKHVKSVFAIFYRGRTLSGKLDRICTAFSAHQHDIPNFANDGEVQAALDEAKAVIGDSTTWLEQEKATSATTLRHLALLVRKWLAGVRREKAIFYTLNMFLRAPERGTVSAQAWVLKSQVATIQAAVHDVHVAAAQGGRLQPYYLELLTGGAGIPKPPTYFKTNKITKVFQKIVDTYGVPRYGEVNPALFSIVTFPFLFGVMYGDVGHGLILTAAAAYMLIKEADLAKSDLGEIFTMAFKGRYMLFMMGCFSVYCGIIYNDLFSIGMTGFGTKWSFGNSTHFEHEGKFIGSDSNDIVPMGIDPAWHNSDNELLFFNSLKMKMSVILGITQMTFGLILKVFNAIHFKSAADLWLEAVPQVIFMVGLFGYMIFLILLKWSINWRDGSAPGAPPSLIDTMINIVLKPGTVIDGMYAGQVTIQTLILLVIFLCVPIMLCGKPYVISRAAKKKQAVDEAEFNHLLASNAAAAAAAEHHHGGDLHDASAGAAAPHKAAAHDDAHGGGGHDDHSFGELFIHQAIETIEFVLGSVSNTASYLRLWALSLAHSQLATVFWERALIGQIESTGWTAPIMIFVGYAVWASMTFGVLMVMDVLECFLHALRLHWVEFQNKFFKADGVAAHFLDLKALADEE